MAKDREFLKRLETLNGAPLQHLPAPVLEDLPQGGTPSRNGRPRQRTEGKPAAGGAPTDSRTADSAERAAVTNTTKALSGPLSLADGAAGSEIAESEWGRAYLIVRPALEMDGGEAANRLLRNGLADAGSALRRRLSRIVETVSASEMVFLDLETTGLGNTPLFLGGLMVWEHDALVVRQYLARNYSEEAAVVWSLREEVGKRKLLVTFNGRSFDWPYVQNRAAAHGIECGPEPEHLDVLLAARRVWRGRGPDCRLQTLESAICGRRRIGDIEGRAVPQAYHDYVRTGDATQMVQILMHNALDLITLAELMARLPVEVSRF